MPENRISDIEADSNLNFVPFGYNRTAWQSLPEVPKNQIDEDIEAVLLDYNTLGAGESVVYVFLLNPCQIDFGPYTADYTEIPTLSNKTAHQAFNHSGEGTLVISDMMLSSYCFGKSLRPIIEGAIALTKADTENNIYAPKILSFRMGTERFEPCVLQQVKYNRDTSLGGEAAKITMSMTLLKVPKPITAFQQEASDQKKRNDVVSSNISKGSPPLPLSAREQNDLMKSAKEYITKMLPRLDQSGIVSQFKSGNYEIKIDKTTGTASFYSNGVDRGVIVQSSGKKIVGGQGTTSLKLKPGQDYLNYSKTPLGN
jgi:hypothetical protein